MNKDIWWLIFVLIIIGIVWSMQFKGGGLVPLEPSSDMSPEEKPPIEIPPPAVPPDQDDKPKEPKIRINQDGAFQSKAEEEYIVLENIDFEDKQTITLSDLILKNRSKETIRIGKDENGNNIILKYGESAVIVSGESPISQNFKLNKCSGYLNQRADFAPYISSNCPQLKDRNDTKNLNNRCLDYLDSLQQCFLPTINADTDINAECAQFVSQHASYAGCVADYKNDGDFDKKEWRIFLGRATEFWNNKHEDIRLLDKQSNLITETSY